MENNFHEKKTAYHGKRNITSEYIITYSLRHHKEHHELS